MGPFVRDKVEHGDVVPWHGGACDEPWAFRSEAADSAYGEEAALSCGVLFRFFHGVA